MIPTLDNPIITGLPDVCADAFAFLLHLRSATPTESFAELRGAATQVLRQLERKANDNGVAKSDLDDAVFAVVATIDELVQTSDWAHRDEWIGDALALQRFDEPNAGEVFYDRLRSISQSNTARRRELLEVYGSCIHLGFRGMYAGGRNREEQRAILTDAVRQMGLDTAPTSLSRSVRPAETVQERIRRWPVWIFVGLGIAACTTIYLVLVWHADTGVNQAIATINAMIDGK